MGRLTHPNIVPVLSARFEETVGLTAVCMPFLGAATLTDLLDLAYPTADAAPPRDAAVVGAAIRSAAYSDDPPPSISGPAAGPKAALTRTPSPASPHRWRTRWPSSTRRGWSTATSSRPTSCCGRRPGAPARLQPVRRRACVRPAPGGHSSVHGPRAAAVAPPARFRREARRSPGPVRPRRDAIRVAHRQAPVRGAAGRCPAGGGGAGAVGAAAAAAARRSARSTRPWARSSRAWWNNASPSTRPADRRRGGTGGRPAAATGRGPRGCGAGPRRRPGRGRVGGAAAAGGRRGRRRGRIPAARRRARVRPRPGRLPGRRLPARGGTLQPGRPGLPDGPKAMEILHGPRRGGHAARGGR